MKLFTFYAAINMLGDSIPSIRYCISDDTLFFSGLGDPTVLDDRFPLQPVFSFLKEYPGALAYCPAVSAERRLGPGWAWDDFIYDYSPEKSAFPVYGNMVRIINRQSGPQPLIEPEIFRDSFQSLNGSSTELPGEIIFREERSNKFTLVSQPLTADTLRIPFIVDDGLIVQMLEDTLGKKIVLRQFPQHCPMRVLNSQPFDSVMKIMLTVSDNFIAEQTLLGISALRHDTISSSRAILESIEQLFPGMEDKMHWVDGSGLSRYNLVNPEGVIMVLNKILEAVPLTRLISLLPNNGMSGKMLKSIREEVPFIYGKSGSMTHVYNISGFLETRRGKILVFCIMNNNFNAPIEDAEYQSGRILISIRDKF